MILTRVFLHVQKIRLYNFIQQMAYFHTAQIAKSNANECVDHRVKIIKEQSMLFFTSSSIAFHENMCGITKHTRAAFTQFAIIFDPMTRCRSSRVIRELKRKNKDASSTRRRV